MNTQRHAGQSKIAGVAIIFATLALFAMMLPASFASNVASSVAGTPESNIASVEVSLELNNGYITYNGQTVASPSTAIVAPEGTDLVFSAAADTGYTLSAVNMVSKGVASPLTKISDGTYVIGASAVVPGTSIQLVTSKNETAKVSTTTDVVTAAPEAKSVYNYTDGSVTVTATLQNANAIPSNAVFKVTPVTASTQGYNYKAYIDALNGQDTGSSTNPTYSDQNTLLYDIAFIVDGKEYEPASGSVKIDMQFNQNQLTNNLGVKQDASASIEVQHLQLSDSVKNSVSTTADATAISASDISVQTVKDQSTSVEGTQSASFVTDSLSVFVLTSNAQTNTWAGTRDTTLNDIIDGYSVGSTKVQGLGALTDFAIVSNSYTSGDHVEGNIRVGTWNIGSNGAQLNNGSRDFQNNSITAINVTKTVLNGTDGTFTFAFFDKSTQESTQVGASFAITTVGGTGTYRISKDDSAFSAISSALISGKTLRLFELDSSNKPVADGDLNGSYKVSYAYSDNAGISISSITNTVFSNYIGEFKSTSNGVIGADKSIFGTVDAQQYVGQEPTLTNEGLNIGSDFRINNYKSTDGFTYIPTLKSDIHADLVNASALSASLANAKNGTTTQTGGLNVINLTSTVGTLTEDLTAAGFSLGSESGKHYVIDGLVNNNEYLLVNIDVTGRNSYTINGQGVWYDGLNPQGENGYSTIGSHVIYNLVTHDGSGAYSTYTGSVKIGDWSAGLLLAPGANVDQTSAYWTGEIIADTLSHAGSEIHKKTITKSDGREASVAVTNTVQIGDPTGSLQLAGTKTLAGRSLTDSDNFTYVVKEGDTTVSTGTSGTNGKITYTDISYTKDQIGDHTYTVSEVIPDDAIAYDESGAAIFVLDSDKTGSGTSLTYSSYSALDATQKAKYSVKSWKYNAVTYDTNTYTFTAKVTDTGSGTLKVETTGNNPAKLDFTNTYGSSVSVQIKAFKKLSGTTLVAGAFTFQLKDAKGNVVREATNDADGNIVFDTIIYSAADLEAAVTNGTATKNSDGTYTFNYTISEVNGGSKIDGVTYDDAVKKVTVTVTNQGNDSLSAKVVYEPESATTTNVFDYNGDTNVASKNINTGHTLKFNGGSGSNPINTWTGQHNGVRSGIVNSTLTNGYPTLSSTGESLAYLFNAQTAGVTKSALSAQNLYNYNTSTGYYSFNSANDYAYLDNGDFMKLGHPAKASNGNFMPFNREGTTGDYHFGLETSTAFTMPEGGQVNGKDMTYSFTKDDDVWVFVDDVLVLDLGGIHDTYGGTINFNSGAVTYESGSKGINSTLADLFNAAGSNWDATAGKTHTLSIFYFERGKNESNFSAEFNLASVATFGNTYEATGTAQLTAKKTFNNATVKTPALSSFEFQLKDRNGDVLQTKKAAADGTVTFEAMSYAVAGVYEYTISEVIPNGAAYSQDGKTATYKGITYDATSHAVSVTMTDNGKGALQPTYTYADGTGATITNTYTAAGSVTFAGTKSIDTRSLKDGDNFTYTVKEGDKTVATGTSGKDGTISFTDITYGIKDVGTHTYTVTEDDTSVDGIAKDGRSYTVTVTVADKGDGTLTVTKSDNATKLNFVNTHAASGSLHLSGTKSMTGRDLAEGDTFTYTVTENGTTVSTGTSGKDGTISFTDITYGIKDVGTHTYTVTENSYDAKGVKSSSQSYTVEVNVSDNGSSTLAVDVSDNATKLDFTNTYAATGALVLSGKKTLNAQTLTEGTAKLFNYVVVDENNNVVSNGTTSADGTISFSTITYTKNAEVNDAGEHTYTVRELIPAGSVETEPGSNIWRSGTYLYDGTNYSLNVSVTDNGDGTLKVETTGNDPAKLDFTNTYEASGNVVLTAVKSYKGSEMAGGDFSFTLKDDGGTTLQTKKNDKDGQVTFDPINYTQDDIGKTFTYTIAEVNDGKGGVAYDSSVKTVKVTVSDAGGGKLNATITDDSDKTDFTNTYTATGSITFAGTKKLEGRKLADGDIFTFDIVENGKVIATATSDATGKIDYPTITYTKNAEVNDAGEHAYTVTERTANVAGITTSTQSYAVNVSVTDSGSGTLMVTTSGDVDSSKLDFTNIYKATGSIVLTGQKTLEGRVLTADDNFTYTVKENGVQVATGISDATGKITYTKIDYSLDNLGTHTYTITEDVPDGATRNADGTFTYKGVTYDNSTQTVTVTVADNGDGTLSITPSYDTKLGTQSAAGTQEQGTTQAASAYGLTKTATNLDGNYQSDVTLSFGAANNQEQDDQKTDVVFVVDASLSQNSTAIKAMQSYIDAVDDNPDVNIGIVYFYAKAKVYRQLDGTIISSNHPDTYTHRGTNLPSGILMAKSMLDADTSVAAANKNMVILSDGDTWVYQQNNELALNTEAMKTTGETVIPQVSTASGAIPYSGPKTYAYKYFKSNIEPTSYEAPADWDTFFSQVASLIAADDASDATKTYETEWSWDPNNNYPGEAAISEDQLSQHAVSSDRSLYYSMLDYRAVQAAGYNAYAVDVNNGVYNRPYGYSFMRYLNGGTLLSTADLASGSSITGPSTILNGSSVVDTMGSGSDNGGYDMDFVNSIDTTDVLLNGAKLEKQVNTDGSFSFFGNLAGTRSELFKLTYTPGENDGYKLDILTTLSGTDKVQVKYREQLANPQTASGEYGAYDADGSESLSGLQTNASATLNPVGGTAQVFSKPTVNYVACGFTNTYDATGTVTFAGTKSMTGRDLKAGDTFTYSVTENGTTVSTGTSGEDGIISFTDITYGIKDVGTHTYIVTENDTSVAGVAKDRASYEVTVTVADNGDGTLSITKSENASALDFTNNYTATGSVTFAGTKSMTGRDLTNNDKYTFNIVETNVAAGKTAYEAQCSNTGSTIDYPTIKYTLADVGVHTYKVTEASYSAAGVTSSTASYDVVVEVTDNGDGTLAAKASDNAANLNFTNAYQTSASIAINGSKAMVGRDFTTGDTFTFDLTADGNAPLPAITSVTVDPASGQSVSFAFDTINYTQADKDAYYTYHVSERLSTVAAVARDTDVKDVVVHVTDDGQGKLTAAIVNDEAHVSDEVKFTNRYAATGSIDFAGTKTVENRSFSADDSIEFTVSGQEGAPMPARTTQTIKPAAGTNIAPVSFGTLSFTQEDIGKSYTYTVAEKATMAGVSADPKYTTVTVSVADSKNHNGNLVVTVDGAAAAGGAFGFVNTYDTNGTTNLTGTKAISGRAFHEGDSATFTVTAADGTPMPLNRTVTIDPTSGTSANVDFGAIEYKRADAGKTYTYTVTETLNNMSGTTTAVEQTVVVTVSDDGDGTLAISKSSNDGENFKLTNTYAATGSVTFAGTKSMTGRDLKADDIYSFSIVETNVAAGKTGYSASVSNDAAGKISYPAIEYTLADVGTHTYVVTENNTSAAGVTKDGTSYTVTVTVADAGNGTLNITKSENASALDFTNTYTATGSITFAGTKHMDGRTLTSDDKYIFDITDTTEGGSGKTWNVSNDVTGKIAYPTIEYTQADAGKTFTYHVSEHAMKVGGVTISTQSYYVSVLVTDNGNGTLTARTIGLVNANALDFTNAYDATGTTDLTGTKTISGRAFHEGDSATFTVTAANGTPMPAVTEVTVSPTSGTTTPVDFGTIKYGLADAGKTYTYTVTEAPNNMAGTTTATVQIVTVIIADNGDGTLTVTKSSNNGQNFDLVNTYSATGSTTLSATKEFTGRDWTDADNFSFTLAASTTNAPMPTVTTASATSQNETANFGPMNFTLADVGKTYTYTITENRPDGVTVDNPMLNGITYDVSTHNVAVTISDKGDGTLDVHVVYDGKDSTPPTFANKYTTNGTSAVLQATKTLSGATLAGGEFNFRLEGTSKNSEGTDMTVSNTASGTAIFGAIAYETPGTYEYKITEVADANPAYTYDSAVHTARVVVTDNGRGQLEATVTYDSDSTIAPVFANTFFEAKTSLQMTKYYFGTNLTAFDFTLTATDANWNARTGTAAAYTAADSIVDNGTNAFTVTVSNGTFDSTGKASIAFPQMAYYAAGDYYYVVHENERSGYITDQAEYLIKVSVAQDMSVTTTYQLRYDDATSDIDAADAAFYNNDQLLLGFRALSATGYTRGDTSTNVYPKVRKTLDDSTLMTEGKFSFVLNDESDTITLATGTNSANGDVNFYSMGSMGLTYTVADLDGQPSKEFKYKISEVIPNDATYSQDGKTAAYEGVIYDRKTIALTVRVEKTSDGTLTATSTYSVDGAITEDPVFANATEGMDIRLQKVSRAGGEGLSNCTYALWMVNENGKEKGADSLVAEATTGEDGWMTFKNVHLQQGVKYYFKEVQAPTGHKVDPYRSAYLTLDQTGKNLVLAENTSDGTHAS